MPLYRQPNLPNGIRLPDEEYNRALLRFVKYCHDVVVLSTEEEGFFLAVRRTDKTPSGPWFIGGQVEVFVETGESLARVFKRETGLDISVHRFVRCMQNRYFFDGNDGGIPHDAVCEVFELTLTPQEIAAVRLDPNEYATVHLQRFTLADIERIVNPMSRQIFLDIWGMFTA